MARLSGLQREVLSLYRSCLREIRNKPAVGVSLPPPHTMHTFLTALLQDSRNNFKRYARAEFQKHLSVNKKDFSTVEYLLRKGHRQLEMYASPGIRNIS
ncbi:hypothetical protein N7509_002172 [Penicillium cosmopolitanum]|uniref:Complex 1 LYR protein domain-containing protein n=1 Tax=Penicillium cosmopolitanum TaxID=1131564 RepID=A0A9W9W8J9_9EURO|nr:uncharacterized protein N7509_002172 [Penicillium cosmopolitanum]KAJ5408289.1 hypothetical protein N7509_002172 [Penicillium cosmopolitanum]